MSTLEWNLVLLEKACVLVTLAFLLARTRLLPSLLKSRLSVRDQVVASLVFLLMGLAEVAFTLQSKAPLDPSMNLRIVAVATAGLLAGPYVGLLTGIAVTLMATLFQAPGGAGMPLPIGISMIMGGAVAGTFRDWKPSVAARPATGLVAGCMISCYRDGLNYLLDHTKHLSFTSGAEAAMLHGLSVALILFVIEQARAQEVHAQTAAMAEVRALQARMSPHFLFNSLNTLSALSSIDPTAVPEAAADLGKFLRAAIDQHDQPFISLEQELAVVDAYLAIEALRFGDRLRVEKEVDASLLGAMIPPFLLQPLIENAVQHGIEPFPQGGHVRLTVGESAGRLCITISDDGVGIAPADLDRLGESDSAGPHAITLLRRRLQALYGSSFQFVIESQDHAGTRVSVRIPCRPSEVNLEPASGVVLPAALVPRGSK